MARAPKDPFVATFARAFVEERRLRPGQQIAEITESREGSARVVLGRYDAYEFWETRRVGAFGVYVVRHDSGVAANPPPPPRYAAAGPDGVTFDLTDDGEFRRFVLGARGDLTPNDLAFLLAGHDRERGSHKVIESLPGLERWLDPDEVRQVRGFTLPIVEDRPGGFALAFCSYTQKWRPDGGTLYLWNATLTGDALDYDVRVLAEGLRSPFFGG